MRTLGIFCRVSSVALAAALLAPAINASAAEPVKVAGADEAAGQCYQQDAQGGNTVWVVPQGNHGDVLNKDECFALDSCNGGMGQSGGVCFKWASAPEGKHLSW